MSAILELDTLRHRFAFETDGAVIKLNDRRLRERRRLHLARAEVGQRLEIRGGAGR